MTGDGPKLTGKQEALITALLTEPTHAAAAKAGVSAATLSRCLRLPEFAAAYRTAQREAVEGAVGRVQAATGHAVETLLAVARTAERDGYRVRAATALLDLAIRGRCVVDGLSGMAGADAAPMGTGDVVQVLSRRLREIDGSELPAAHKARLTAALLRAIGVDVLDKRLEALQAVLIGRKDRGA